MNFPEGVEFQKTQTLHSGRFYWVHSVSRCYRVNEADHFLKDLTNDLICYFDKKDLFHHFNRTNAKYSASTLLSDLFQLPVLKELDFYEFTQESIENVKNGITVKNGDSVVNNNLVMMKKLADTFSAQKQEDEGVEYSVEELKNKYSDEYIEPPDLPNNKHTICRNKNNHYSIKQLY